MSKIKIDIHKYVNLSKLIYFKKRAIFFLGPRLIDFDTSLPLAILLKSYIPELDIKFISFSKSHFNYLNMNKTLIEGVKRCGELHCFQFDKEQSTISLYLELILSNIKLVFWILTSNKPLLFSSKAYKSGMLARSFIISRIKKGKSIMVLPTRLIESCLLPEQIEEFKNKISEPSPTWINKLYGRNADGIIYFHDDQEILTSMCVTEPLNERFRYYCAGILTTHHSWQDFINSEADKYITNLNESHKNRRIYTIYAGKSMQSRFLKSDDSIKYSFHKVIDLLVELEPEAIILIRPHPAGMNEAFITDALERHCCSNIKIDLSHPDVQANISNRIIFTAPTNIMSTMYSGKRIDCIDYSDQSLSKFESNTPYFSYGIHYANPSSNDFREVFERLMKNELMFNDMTYKENKFIKRNMPNPEKLQNYLNSI